MKKLTIKDILKQTDHRSTEIPQTPYSLYQEWNRALFFHWKVDAESLLPFIPEGLEIDLFNNHAYISLVALSKLLSVLPYEHADMYRNNKDYFQSVFKKKKFSFGAKYEVGSEIIEKTDLDCFLTERYCLYVDADENLYRYDIHHIPWPLNHLNVYELETNYILGAINLNSMPLKMHYSPGVQVVAWQKIKL